MPGTSAARAGLQPLDEPADRVGWIRDEPALDDGEMFVNTDLEFYCIEVVKVEPEVFSVGRGTFYELGAVYSLVIVFDKASHTFKRLGCCYSRKYKGESAELRTITLV